MRIGIVGAGAMGSGIAQVAAMAGHEVLVFDSFESSKTKGRDTILSSLNKFATKGKFSDAQSNEIFDRINFVETLDFFSATDIVIEAISEDEDAKKQIFIQLESIVTTETILASNTSSISITSIARNLSHPERCIGIHFFNPPVMMKLVEIIPALQTASKVVLEATQLIAGWGKIVVHAKDTPGFIVNRIARPYYSEALRITEEQIATPQQIDSVMKNAGFKMGPFELMDYIGNDINLAVTKSVWTAMYYDPRYKPSFLQENLVRAGWLGRKTGKGYYDYTQDQPAVDTHADADAIRMRIVSMLINEAADALYLGIASKEDIDMAMVHGVNYPKGLLAWADEIGIEYCVAQLDQLYDHYHEDRYRCSAGLRNMLLLEKTYFE
ncbi:MAG: 3-hydroxyacyl-CoA dehydrogenase NAD-binding domain-containing protein [Bacteroidota bacterium]|nr:3-hydroxyacyl-CoA dehydrogenase NAD-binding domain-containing protein [Bacteroidota bacterium]